jgi:YggT family protein
VLLSFIPVTPRNQWVRQLIRWLYEITDPLLKPFQKFTLRMGGGMGIDFSPFIVLILIGVLRSLLRQWLVSRWF